MIGTSAGWMDESNKSVAQVARQLNIPMYVDISLGSLSHVFRDMGNIRIRSRNTKDERVSIK